MVMKDKVFDPKTDVGQCDQCPQCPDCNCIQDGDCVPGGDCR